jgi:uncharacterized lipoprotein YddW (UPF0748 family)
MIYSNEITAENAENIVKRLHKLYFTDIFFISKNIDGKLYYKSEYVNAEEDKLNILCKLGETYNIGVYAWFCTFTEGYHGRLFGDGISEFLLKNPTLAAVDISGKNTLEKPVPCDRGFENYVCPANPSVQEYEITLLKELVKKYPIKGIHLDFIRYPFPGDYCYCNNCQYIFKRDFGFELDDEEAKKYKNLWRRSIITNFVNRVSCEIRELNAEMQISALVWKYNDCLEKTQDWIEWDIDFISPMLYNKSYGEEIDWIEYEIKKNMKIYNRRLIPAVGGPYSSLFTKREWKEIDNICRRNDLEGNLYGHYGLLDIMNTLDDNSRTGELKKILIWQSIFNLKKLLKRLRCIKIRRVLL